MPSHRPPRALLTSAVTAVVAAGLAFAPPAQAAPLAQAAPFAQAAPLAQAAPAPAPPAVTVPPATTPSGRSLLDAQVALVSAQQQPAVNAATGQLHAAQAALGSRQAVLAHDRAQAAADDASVQSDTTHTAAATATLASATQAADAAAAAVDVDRNRLQGIAVDVYTGPQAAPGASSNQDLQQAQLNGFVQELVAVTTNTITASLHQDLAARQTTTEARTRASRALADDQRTLAASTTAQTRSGQAVVGDEAGVAATTASLTAAQAASDAVNATLTRTIVALANPPGAPNDGSPTILGPPAMTAGELAGWFKSSRYADATAATIDQLAGWYVSEGAAEGVRGDLAFAQAIVETGGFASPDAVNVSNFAGIGHCNSCGGGLPFPNPQMGVRGQIQLLRTYADPTLTAVQLHNPLVVPSLTPATEPNHGCCQTWQSLTGRWATDPLYGHTVLGLYGRMLDWALQHP